MATALHRIALFSLPHTAYPLPSLLSGLSPQRILSTTPQMQLIPEFRRVAVCGLALALVGLSTGCTTTKSQAEPGSEQFADTDVARIQLIPWAPNRAHVKVGEIIIEPAKGASWREIDLELRQAAADLGAHAMYVVWDPKQRFSSVQVDPVASDQKAHYPANGIVAVAIRFQ